MEGMIASLGVAAGAGWGVAGGLAVALWVALKGGANPQPPATGFQLTEVEQYPFGRRAG